MDFDSKTVWVQSHNTNKPVLGLQQALQIHEAHQEPLNVFRPAKKATAKMINYRVLNTIKDPFTTSMF